MGSRGLRARLAAAAILAAVAASGPPSRAQSAADRETARALMDEGFSRREKSDHKGALERFEAADALMHVPTTGIEVARERMAMGLLIEAREALSSVARFPVKAGEPAPFAEARAQAQKLDEDLSLRIPSLKVVVRGADGPLQVSVDGAEVPTATLIAPRRLNPGPHTVLARVAGREKQEQLGLRERESKEVVLDLSPMAPSTPAPPEDAPAQGRPSVVPRVMTWTGFGIAAAGVIVGSIAGVASLSAVSSAKQGCDANNKCPPPTHSDIDSARTTGTISTIAFIAAGGGALLGVAGLLLTKSEPPKEASLDGREPGAQPPPRFAGWIGPGSAGFGGVF